MLNCNFFFRLPQIYDEFLHTVDNADHEKDLKWWSNNHGVNMAMNWPQFEVSFLSFMCLIFNLKKLIKLYFNIRLLFQNLFSYKL